jgi:hypothetical protein
MQSIELNLNPSLQEYYTVEEAFYDAGHPVKKGATIDYSNQIWHWYYAKDKEAGLYFKGRWRIFNNFNTPHYLEPFNVANTPAKDVFNSLPYNVRKHQTVLFKCRFLKAYEMEFNDETVIYSAKTTRSAKNKYARALINQGCINDMAHALKAIKISRRRDLENRLWHGENYSTHTTVVKDIKFEIKSIELGPDGLIKSIEGPDGLIKFIELGPGGLYAEIKSD